MERRFLKLEGNRVVGFDPAHEGAERAVVVGPTGTIGCSCPGAAGRPYNGIQEISSMIEKGMADARKTPEYFEEAFDRGIISVGSVFEMLAAFKETRDNLTRAGQLTLTELRKICEMRTTDIPQEEIRQVINNLSKRLT